MSSTVFINPFLYTPAGGASDSDAEAFLTAAGIVDGTITSAIDDLVIDLKAAGVWAKCLAIYPFVGGTAATHKWNLKDPEDNDASYRLVFGGGWTHSATGALPNGTTAYADTKLAPSAALSNNNTHLSYYSGTDVLLAEKCDFGATDGSGVGHQLFLRTDILVGSRFMFDSYSVGGRISGNVTTSLGLFIDTVTDGSTHKGWQAGVQLGTTGTPGGDVTGITATYHIGARNRGGTVDDFSSRECRFASIGTGLSDTNVADMQAAVQAFQTTLGRQV